MGCEQCKLLDAKKQESDENVIANVTADRANQCENTVREEAATNSLSLTLPINQSSNLANEQREGSEVVMEETVLDHNRNVTSLSLVQLGDLDSNILNSTERLEVHDEISDLTPSAATCSVDGTSSSENNQTFEAEPDNRSQGDEEAHVATTEEVSDTPVRKKRGTVRVNSMRGNKSKEGKESGKIHDSGQQQSNTQVHNNDSSRVLCSTTDCSTTGSLNVSSAKHSRNSQGFPSRSNQVARKLSINPGDAVISPSQRDFVQLGGHQGHFHIAGPGSLWKQQSKDGEVEAKVLKELNESSLHAYTPDYLGSKEHDGKRWIGMEDVMCHFTDGCGMDIKIGTRTFKESEVKNQKLREDLYEKMVKQDPSEPTEQENASRGITKLRYMTFRERESSSQTLGFRIEAMKLWGQETTKDFKTLKYRDQVKNALLKYFNPLSKSGVEGFYRELVNLNQLLEESTYFKEHEFVGTSLLFIYDHDRVGIWLIDFGKTTDIRDLIEGGQITHEKPWELGNYEDGYFTGIRMLISILDEIYREREEDDETVHQHTTIRVN